MEASSAFLFFPDAGSCSFLSFLLSVLGVLTGVLFSLPFFGCGTGVDGFFAFLGGDSSKKVNILNDRVYFYHFFIFCNWIPVTIQSVLPITVKEFFLKNPKKQL